MMAGHQIAYRNVASKYYHFHPEDIELAIQDFMAILEKHNYHPTGAIFFAILSDPTNEEEMVIQLFLPIMENKFETISEEQVFFQSYFLINPMVMTRVTEDFTQQSQVKYWELFEYLERHNLEQKTPVFVEYKHTHSGRNYIKMSVGM
ncbi:hypothetical protein Pryu01_02176 [Paraliobacillus ryukyuensis]|uniref:Uncharacterized protein DUF5085 n=1 Tax=Paraliobacillus ryukyuensis TaxID=200904 RepID=A0A366E3Z2_9BACI|nr:DUF5085 family protein [Paraliobacillus ryukyuensis]RBO97091.1 uncharacterized protein DUF5085 [Paraliobacillus ryukyuensis]